MNIGDVRITPVSALLILRFNSNATEVLNVDEQLHEIVTKGCACISMH